MTRDTTTIWSARTGQILEVQRPAVAQLVRDRQADGFLLDSYSLVLYGSCGCARRTAIAHGNSNEPHDHFSFTTYPAFPS